MAVRLLVQAEPATEIATTVPRIVAARITAKPTGSLDPPTLSFRSRRLVAYYTPPTTETEEVSGMASKRAIRDFDVAGDPWPTVDGWAQRQGYRTIGQAEGRRQYRKGHGMLVASRAVEVSTNGGRLHVEAWVASNVLSRAFALFIVPAEITVESGGAKAILPRKIGRTEVNDLLQAFGQQPLG